MTYSQAKIKEKQLRKQVAELLWSDKPDDITLMNELHDERLKCTAIIAKKLGHETDEDRFKAMAEKNPNLNTLKDKLNLTFL